MTFLAPWALWAAGAVSAAVIALHILASKNPRVTPLPTARFIPDVPLRATARAMRLSDVLLMMLRVAAVLLVGLAFARPEVTRGRRAVGRVVMVDRYPAESRRAAADSLERYFHDGDVAYTFDSAAYRVAEKAPFTGITGESLGRDPHGSISAALATAMRAASSLRGNADSVEIILVSAFRSSELDAATSAIRAAWPGRIRLVRIADRTLVSGAPERVTYAEQVYNEVPGAPLDDPMRAAIAFTSHLDTGRIGTDSVRIDRGSARTADSTWTRNGFTLVRWPAMLDSSGFPTRARVDTAGAVAAGDAEHEAVVVAPFVRAVDPPPGRVVARWADGSPAATERKMMNGCVRDVAIPIARAGDLVLRESTRRLIAALTRPCNFSEIATPVSDAALAQLRGTGPLVATRALESRTAPPGHLATWLLAAAFVLLLLEPALRRPRASV